MIIDWSKATTADLFLVVYVPSLVFWVWFWGKVIDYVIRFVVDFRRAMKCPPYPHGLLNSEPASKPGNQTKEDSQRTTS